MRRRFFPGLAILLSLLATVSSIDATAQDASSADAVNGGRIEIDWRDDGVWMTGPTTYVFSARLSRPFLDSL